MMLGCMLCLETSDELQDDESIKVNSEKWHELKVENLIEQHLWPFDTSLISQSWICSVCWQELRSFHVFYTRVKVVYDGCKNTLVKAEKSHDPVHDPLGDVKVEILKTESDLNPEIIISEQMTPQENTDIKQEDELVIYEENLLENHSSDSDNTGNDDDDDDDLPLSQAFNKHVPTKPKIKQSKASYYPPKIRHSQYDAFIKEHYKINCNHCMQPFECFSALEDHFRRVHNERAYVICCDTKLFKAGLLVDHLNYHNNPEYFKCVHCDKTFQLRRRLLTHLKTHKELKYCCDICGRKFLDKKKLERHKITHMSEEEKKFPCKECGKLFANDYVLNQHHRVVHLRVYAKICDICGQTVPDTSSFKYHMEKHQTEKRHSLKCDECGLLVSSSVCLKRHKDLKHPIGGSHDYTCHICNRVSPTLRALNKHIKCAHEMGYDYKCTLCEKAFKRSDNLKAHMSTHTGTPLFRCSWCPKEFYSNGNMYMHRKKAHPAEWEEEKRKRYSGNFPPNSKSTNAPNSVNLSE